MQIEHDPNETRPNNRVYWILAFFVAAGWANYLMTREIDWYSLALGAFSMGLLMSWTIEKTGNKIPESWRN